jgi:hypothetical protein
VVQLAGHNPMPSAMAREEYYVAAGEAAGKELVGGGAKRCFNRTPFLVFKALDIVQAAAADNADAVRKGRHVFFVASESGLSLRWAIPIRIW